MTLWFFFGLGLFALAHGTWGLLDKRLWLPNRILGGVTFSLGVALLTIGTMVALS